MNLESYINSVHEATLNVRGASAYALAQDLQVAWREGRTVFTCGNGGSAANASHLAQDLSKGTYSGKGEAYMRCICLNDSMPSLTAWANDAAYKFALSAQLRILGQPGDLLIAISGSGNSPNITTAVHEASSLAMHTWGITGFGGGKLAELAHNSLNVPCGNMGQIEAVHGIFFHWLVEALHKAGPYGALEGAP